jgi:putative DNA primase/helicase
MKTTTSNGVARFTASNPCPVCGGSEHDARGQGQRCHGYLSSDRKFIYCAREEFAGKAAHDAGSNCYRHTARGPCPCGEEHAPADPKPARKGKLGELDQVYPYHDIDGTVPFEVVRFKNPKDFRQRRPKGNGQYDWNLKGIETILFKRPQLLRADSAAIVWICEGEKDANNLGAKGEVTTCNAGGAGKWKDRYRDDLKGRNVVILPHNDQPGRDHAQQVAYSLHGVAASVKVVELPGLPDKGDVSDFLAAGGTVDQLRRLARETPEWTPPAVPEEIQVNEAVDDPHRLARIYLDSWCLHHGQLILRSYRGEYVRWDGSAYRPEATKEVNAYLARICKAEFDAANKQEIRDWIKRGKVNFKGEPCPEPQARKVGTRLIGDTALALASLTLLEGSVQAPAWLVEDPPFADPVEVIPCRNALVHIPSLVVNAKAMIEPSPAFFNTYALDFDFDRQAPSPTRWLEFLAKLWEDDQESIDTLQEWSGYCLTPDTSQQKILAMFGPKRSGRGTIARVLRALLGPENVAGPSLTSLAGNFGLAPLIGKPLAIISDARMSARTDQAVVVERLLMISGEDAMDIDRKHLDFWTGKLPTRLVLISNELPQLKDASGALAGRLILLRLTQSFFGKEDKNLLKTLLLELPGILLWAIEGWRRLNERGHFLQPASGAAMVEQMEDIASPVGSFLRERYEIGAGFQTDVETIFARWCAWCEAKNRKPGDETTLGRDLRTVMPWLKTDVRKVRDPNTGKKKYVRYYEGLREKPSEDDLAF